MGNTYRETSGIVDGGKATADEHAKELFLSIVLSLPLDEQYKLWGELRSAGYINRGGAT